MGQPSRSGRHTPFPLPYSLARSSSAPVQVGVPNAPVGEVTDVVPSSNLLPESNDIALSWGDNPLLGGCRRVGAVPDTVLTMAEEEKRWTPSTVGEAREYLDTHERDGDPAIVEACEALVDAIEHRTGPGQQSSGRTDGDSFAKPPLEQLEEEGAD